MNHFLPIMEYIKGKKRILWSCIVLNETLEPQHQMAQLMAKQTLTHLCNIKYQDIWCAACLLNPVLSIFHFLPRETASFCRNTLEILVRKMLSSRQKELASSIAIYVASVQHYLLLLLEVVSLYPSETCSIRFHSELPQSSRQTS